MKKRIQICSHLKNQRVVGGGGVIKLDEGHMSADFLVEFDGNALEEETCCDIMPDLLNTMWKSVELITNGVTLTNSNSENLFVSDVLNRLYQHQEKKSDLAGCNLDYRNSPSQNSYLTRFVSTATVTRGKVTNPGAKKRIDAIKAKKSLIGDLRFCFFGMGSQYLPVNNTLTVKLTKDTSRRFFTGSEVEYTGAQTGKDSQFHIVNAHDVTPHAAHTARVLNGGQSATNLANLDKLKTKLQQFEIHYKVQTPDAQIQETMNRMLDVEGKYINVFYQEIHVRNEVHKLSNSQFSCNNVLILTIVRTDYVNGDFFRTPAHCTWEKIKHVVVKVNNVPLPVKIDSKEDAYFHTRRALHLGDSEKNICRF